MFLSILTMQYLFPFFKATGTDMRFCKEQVIMEFNLQETLLHDMASAFQVRMVLVFSSKLG